MFRLKSKRTGQKCRVLRISCRRKSDPHPRPRRHKPQIHSRKVLLEVQDCVVAASADPKEHFQYPGEFLEAAEFLHSEVCAYRHYFLRATPNHYSDLDFGPTASQVFDYRANHDGITHAIHFHDQKTAQIL